MIASDEGPRAASPYHKGNRMAGGYTWLRGGGQISPLIRNPPLPQPNQGRHDYRNQTKVVMMAFSPKQQDPHDQSPFH